MPPCCVHEINWSCRETHRLEIKDKNSFFLVLVNTTFCIKYSTKIMDSLFACIVSSSDGTHNRRITGVTLAAAFAISRMRFRLRRPYMNMALVLGMFPGFMTMIAVYYVLKSINLTQSLAALIFVYSAGAGLNFYIAKGFFDTVPRALDEAARIDGATMSQVFFKITLPLSKPIIVYTALMAFASPWMDFIFARIIMGDNYEKYTVAIGLFTMLSPEFIDQYFTRFAAGCVVVAIPITLLFVFLQRYFVEGITGGAVKG